jgi:hypothetical protein
VKTYLKAILQAAGIGCLAAASTFGQITSSGLLTMKMWPTVPVKWLGSPTDFSKINYGYYYDNSPSYGFTDGDFAAWNKWRFAMYTGLSGKTITAWGDWYTPTPPPPVVKPGGIAKPCEHTHIAYGVWLQYGYYSGGKYYTGWNGPFGGGKSGVQGVNNSCPHTVNSLMGWGTDTYTFSLPKVGNPYTLMIVGASALSHGAIGCPIQGCINQPAIFAYAVPN